MPRRSDASVALLVIVAACASLFILTADAVFKRSFRCRLDHSLLAVPR